MLYRHLTASAILSLSIGLTACSSTPLELPAPPDNETQTLLFLDTKFELSSHTPSFPTPLASNGEMEAFVAQYVPSTLPENGRLRYLTDAIRNPKSLGVSYSPGLTLTAEETFTQRQGNCISLTTMFIALAKQAGLTAWINEVVEEQSQELLSDERIAVYKHINAVVELEDRKVVVDFSSIGEPYQRPQKRISEQRAAAQYFSNHGVDMLNAGEDNQAYLYFKKALQLSPETSYIWGNLGTLLNRKGLVQEAELAFRKAYTLDNNDHTALNNLERLYLATGNNKQAKRIRKIMLQKQLNNPFWHYGSARQAYEDGKPEEALRSVLRAIRLDDEQYRFYYFAAQIYRSLGDRDNYHRYGIKAARMKKDQQE